MSSSVARADLPIRAKPNDEEEWPPPGNGDPDRDLTPQEEIFVKAYLETNGPGRAYVEAYGRPGTRKANFKGREILQRPAVKRIVEAARTAAQDKVAEAVSRNSPKIPDSREITEKYVITKERIANSLAAAAWSDIRDYVEWNESDICLKPSAGLTLVQAYPIVEVWKGPHGLRIKLADKVGALVKLAELFGFTSDDNAVPVVDEEKRKQIKAWLIKRLEEMAKSDPLVITEQTLPRDPNDSR
jgi:hypothetical protein